MVRRRSFATPASDDRPVVSEYHATGSHSASFMIRQGSCKLIWYVDGRPQLFDLASDPEELQDLGTDPQHGQTLARMHDLFLRVLDPRKVDARAKARQAELRQRLGGDAAILASADYGYSPVPREALT